MLRATQAAMGAAPAPIEPATERLRGAYGTTDAAYYLSLSPREMARLIASGEVRSFRRGRRRLIRRTDLDAWLDAQA